MKRSSLVTAIALSAVLLGSAYAQGLGGRLLAGRAAPVVQVAGLSAAQQLTLQDLQQRQLAFRRAAHDEVGSLIDAAQNELADPQADLRSLSQQTTRTFAALALEANSLREARLAFYETLDAEQQAAIREHLQRRLARLERVHALVGDFLVDAQ